MICRYLYFVLTTWRETREAWVSGEEGRRFRKDIRATRNCNFPERALPIGFFSTLLLPSPHLQAHTRLSERQEAQDWIDDSRPAGAECAVSSRGQGSATDNGHCAAPG